MTTIAIKELEERNVASEITSMVWSDRMDLVALSNVKGEVALHRLTWTKAWNLSPPKEGVTVKGIAWRPDGKIIAVAYSTGQILLIKVEDKTVLHSITMEADITYICWIQEKNNSNITNYINNIDYSTTYLADLRSRAYEDSNSNDEPHKSILLQDQTDFNLLLIGCSEGFVHVEIFGCFPCTTVDITSYLGRKCSIKNIHLNEDLNQMFITVHDCDSNISIILLDSAIFQTHMKELFAIGLKWIKLMSLISCLSSTITTITETWENILLEMDNKLSKYANKVPEGGVTADFLDLLMFGICSDEMREFLITDLTKKGLEKFGQTIEMSYSSIQKLLLICITKYVQNITYHLAELRGMARFDYRFNILGLSESAITDTIQSSSSFLIKCGEMQEIINQSIIDYKAFFRWLYVAIINLSEETLPNDIPKMTEQELAYIAEFLQNFDNIGAKNSSFLMERIGQYLNDAPLKIPPNMKENKWTNFLLQNRCLQDDVNIIKHYENMSLIQQYKHLRYSIEQLFSMPEFVIKEQFQFLEIIPCFININDFKITQINCSKEDVFAGFLTKFDRISLMKIETKPVCLKAAHFNFENCKILDLKFYSNTTLSVLLQDNDTKSNILYQLPFYSSFNQFTTLSILQQDILEYPEICNLNALNLQPKLFKTIDGMVASQFAVSGSRKVGIVLSENRRKIRLYEMEGEEEDDEDADMSTNTGIDIDTSG